MSKTIILNNIDSYEYIDVDTGYFTRKRNGEVFCKGSSDWLCRGFAIINKFGNVIEVISRLDFFILCEKNAGDLFYKNGKARFRVLDIDHGTNRQWGRSFNKGLVYIQN